MFFRLMYHIVLPIYIVFVIFSSITEEKMRLFFFVEPEHLTRRSCYSFGSMLRRRTDTLLATVISSSIGATCMMSKCSCSVSTRKMYSSPFVCTKAMLLAVSGFSSFS